MRTIKYFIFTRFLGVIILQVAFLILVGRFYFEKNFQHTIKENSETLSLLAENFHAFYDTQIEESLRLTQGSGFVPFQKQKAIENVAQFIKIKGTVSTAHYYKADGKLEFYVTMENLTDYKPESSVDKHRDENFKIAFNKAVTTKLPVVSDPLFTHKHFFYHALLIPVFEKNKLQGILSLAIFPKIRAFNHILNGLALSSDNFLILADIKGNIVAANNVTQKETGPLVTEALEQIAQPQKLKKKKYYVENVAYYILSTKVKELPLIVILGVNNQNFANQKKRFFDFIFSMTAISTLLVLGLSLIISSKITQGMKAISASVLGIREGKIAKQEEHNYSLELALVLDELEDLSIEVQKGKLLGNLWGQDHFIKYEKKDK
jgi:hypothetical protein